MAYIAKMEARGFKSLGSLDIKFPRGLCCLAGPNGAGKSCLMEAVAFVAGSSAAMLRVQRLCELQCSDVSKVSFQPSCRTCTHVCKRAVMCADWHLRMLNSQSLATVINLLVRLVRVFNASYLQAGCFNPIRLAQTMRACRT